MHFVRRFTSLAVLMGGVTLAAFLTLPPPQQAYAQESLVPADSADASQLEAFAKALFDAAHKPDKSLAIALGLIALVYAMRRWGVPAAHAVGAKSLADALSGDRAGAALTLVLALLGGLATAFAAGQHINATLLITAVGIGAKAIGGYVGVRKLFGIKSDAADPVPLP